MRSIRFLLVLSMAESQKKPPPPPVQVDAPRALMPMMQAFHAETEEAAEALIIEAARAIAPKDVLMGKSEPSEAELETISSLMRGLKPQDSLETLYAAQIIVSHVLGMRKLASEYFEDERMGLKMLRLSNEIMQQLTKKRSGGAQNITVNYHHHGGGNSFAQTVIKENS